MKKYSLVLLGAIVLAACSTPKYTYYFDHYDYNAKKKTSAEKTVVVAEQPVQESVLAIDESALTSSTNENEPVLAKPASTTSVTLTKEEAIAKIESMSKEERKELKKGVKQYVKESKKDIKEGKATKAMPGDVKLAAIFGVIGIVLLIIGGDALTIIGSVALLVGLFFLVRWLINNN
ncbi:MAG TPA: hypothetical protein VFU05_04145 [Cyclobacteriaceae bacterium]|nr:hypothetical protein [Cyclobacteriaceae bacterium]